MRFTLCLIPLMLVGCLSSGSSTNPMKRGEAAPVTSTVATVSTPAPLSLTAPPPVEDNVEKIKALFELWQSLEPQMLKLAHDLDDDELAELNDWMRPRGSEIKRTCNDSTHDHSSKSGNGKGAEGAKKAKKSKGRVF